MVDGERQIPASTILAAIAIASQDIFSGEYHAFVRNAIKNRKPKYARHRE